MLAPIPGRGQDSHSLSTWLKSVEAARSAAERKRLFYVACTRAREELHLFASPDTTKDGAINRHYLSLLKSAWPAAEPHFQAPAAAVPKTPAPPADSEPLSLAADADIALPVIHRLPADFDPAARFAAARAHSLPSGDPASHTVSPTQFVRPEGSYAARSFGTVVHACLERLAGRILDPVSPAALLEELPDWSSRIAAMLRADGLPRAAVEQLTRDALDAVGNALRDRDGRWVLAAHSGSSSEYAVTVWPTLSIAATKAPSTVRVDRVFYAGSEPHAEGDDYLWIVDYKTASHGPAGLDDFLAAQRAAYGPQLETYARILAHARSKSPGQIRLALYFPTIPRLHWWNAPALQAENCT
jgi:ATP-dependent exoDNAse (exonuclease V) beta subunit